MKQYGIVNKDIITDPELSVQAKGLYSLLCCYCNSSRTCYPSINTLADYSNKSVRSISQYIKELKSKGYITKSGHYYIVK
tara:strand:+ start:164 stop:403 length:240 start_codon:yes stop_codon:yes gene_type:complete